jgi:hypothetical protein
MNRRELFTLAMLADNYKRLDWIYSVFCLTKGEQTIEEDYPYRITADPSGYSFRNDTGEMVHIDDAPAGQPIYSLKEVITVTSADILTASGEITTTYGELLTNYILLVYPFGNKLPYMSGRFSVGKIEELILPRLVDDTEDEVKDPKVIYVHEYIKFADSCFYLTGLSQVCVWAATEKNMTAPDGLKEFKAALLVEYKDRLSDPEAIAEMETKLVAFDKAWRGDDPGNNFLLSKKTVNVVRKKKFLMGGGEADISGSGKMTLIQNSLEEGWGAATFPVMNNSLRMASYSRGAETMLGGVEVKWMLRASSNSSVTKDDCGSLLGVPKLVTSTNLKSLVGLSVVSKTGAILVNDLEAAGSYLGKHIMVRSPMYCKLDRTDFCKVCVGKRLAETPNALSSAVSSYGSAFLTLSLMAAHGRALEVQKMNYLDELL